MSRMRKIKVGPSGSMKLKTKRLMHGLKVVKGRHLTPGETKKKGSQSRLGMSDALKGMRKKLGRKETSSRIKRLSTQQIKHGSILPTKL